MKPFTNEEELFISQHCEYCKRYYELHKHDAVCFEYPSDDFREAMKLCEKKYRQE